MSASPHAEEAAESRARAERWLLIARLFGGCTLVTLFFVLVLAVSANGVTLSCLSLTGLLVAIGLIGFVKRPAMARWRALWWLAVAGCLVGVVAFIVVRLWSVPSPQAFRFVEGGRRDASPPWLSRIADERETVLMGLQVSNLFGMIRGREMEHLEILLERAYSPEFEPWPNAALINALPSLPRHLEHVPAGSSRPCLVFLHGFGGQLTAYLRVLDLALGDRYVIVAPFLDFTGAFWTPRGKAAVRTLVAEHLPPEVDPERVFLVGLSNGAIGTTALMQDPDVARYFRGFILVSGSGEVVRHELQSDVLMIMGSEDPRFPLAYNQGVAERLRASGAQVETSILAADHFIWLSHSRQMTDAIDRWVSKR
jgi:predicted esterase